MEKIRLPAVAGQFYPEDKRELEGTIEEFLSKAKKPEIKGEIFGLISPHAGYVFSGQTAAYGAKAIEGKNYETVILMGDSHYEYFDGVSIWEKGKWLTPLGEIEIDEEVAEKILSFSERIFVRDSAHLFEHSLEVQIPFLQKVLKNFKIVPIIFGSENKDWKILAGSILKSIGRKKILIVASTDLSHYPPYDIARVSDREIINSILGVEPEKLIKKAKEIEKENLPNLLTPICSKDAVLTLLEIGKNLKGKAKLLDYRNSGDSLFGEKSNVVGYSSIVFFR